MQYKGFGNMQNKLIGTLLQLFFISILSLSLILPTKAGERALLNVIGYSNDGRYFAFEEYGVQDGSGFAYSSIYIIDINDDSWVIGTPIRVLEEYDETTYEVEPIDYGKNIQKTRAMAYEQAKFRLEGLNITTPAWGIAFNGDGESENDGLSLRYFLPRGFGATLSENFTISLEIYKTQSALTCVEWFGEEPVGFLINITNEAGETIEAYRDKTLSRSRGCAMTYKIYGIYVPFGAVDFSSAIALISVYAGGYEGPDRRFIAVPIGKIHD